MKKKTFVLAFVILMIATVTAFAATYRCKYDNSTMTWTGNTKVEWGKLTKEYKCPVGHTSWIVEENSYTPPSHSLGPTCQYDNTSLYFTGNTKVEWGKLVKEYKCPVGHTYWLAD
jgi:hypothetical protein